jgi:twitching motility protein PilT
VGVPSVTDPKNTLDVLLKQLVERQASDLHLKPMRPPLMRVDGRLVPLEALPLQPAAVETMLDTVIPERLRDRLSDEMAIDFGYGLDGVSRFRASIFYQRGTKAAVFRRVPYDFPSLEDWGLPPVISEFCDAQQGLVLVTGPTGSGKSSTLAAMMKRIATTRSHHIVTIEDPIEFLISDDLASVSQREIGIDTPSFAAALRTVLRQDPDVIMVGEMRDEETIRTVLTAAETGHLVLSTLHTNSASQTIDRIMTDFPETSHRQLRQQLSASLEGLISMQLVPQSSGEGMVAAVEIVRSSPRVQKLILEGEFEALDEEIESSVSYYKMQSMNQSLAALEIHGTITHETAMQASPNPGDLELLLRKIIGTIDAQASLQGEEMAETTSDFSKILELQEIKKRYDDMQEHHNEELAARDRQIAELRVELTQLAQGDPAGNSQVEQLQAENQRLTEQIRKAQADYESKLERLNRRMRDLSARAASEPPPAEASRKGFFRR